MCGNDKFGPPFGDACEGDSGGPMIIKEKDGYDRYLEYVIGVVSYGNKHCGKNV
jgi:secreted trypsin-like serine protease